MYLYIGTGDNNDVCLMKQSGDLFTTTEIEFQHLLDCGEITCNEDEFKMGERKMYEAYSLVKALVEITEVRGTMTLARHHTVRNGKKGGLHEK